MMKNFERINYKYRQAKKIHFFCLSDCLHVFLLPALLAHEFYVNFAGSWQRRCCKLSPVTLTWPFAFFSSCYLGVNKKEPWSKRSSPLEKHCSECRLSSVITCNYIRLESSPCWEVIPLPMSNYFWTADLLTDLVPGLNCRFKGWLRCQLLPLVESHDTLFWN